MSHDSDLDQIGAVSKSLREAALMHLSEQGFTHMESTVSLCHVQLAVEVFFATRRVEVETILHPGNVREKMSFDVPDSEVLDLAANADAASEGFRACVKKLLDNPSFIAAREGAELAAAVPPAPTSDGQLRL